MSDAKSRIMQNVAHALDQKSAPTAGEVLEQRQRAYAGSATPHPVWQASAVERFIEKFESQAGTWTRVEGIEAVGGAVADHLSGKLIDQQIRVAPHPLLEKVVWPEHLDVIVSSERAPDSNVAVSVAEAGMAETGTLVFYSGAEIPTTLQFLPDYHIAILRLPDMVSYMEEVWQKLNVRDDFPPRALSFITGPSRTADVELTIQIGAHGPREVHLILVE